VMLILRAYVCVCMSYIIYSLSMDPYRIAKSIWIWKYIKVTKIFAYEVQH